MKIAFSFDDCKGGVKNECSTAVKYVFIDTEVNEVTAIFHHGPSIAYTYKLEPKYIDLILHEDTSMGSAINGYIDLYGDEVRRTLTSKFFKSLWG